MRIDEKAAAEEMLNIYSGYDYYQTTSNYLSEEKMTTPKIEIKEKEPEFKEEYLECQWCKESFPESELREEVDLGYLCYRCIKAIQSRGESLYLKG